MKKNKKPPCETNPFKEAKPKYYERKYIKWVNPFTPINQGKLGSSQSWRLVKPKRYYD